MDRKPLIYYTLQEALKSRYLDGIIVSTEDEEIAEVSKKHGTEVIERPKDLARDESPTIDAVLHALDFLGKMGMYQGLLFFYSLSLHYAMDSI